MKRRRRLDIKWSEEMLSHYQEKMIHHTDMNYKFISHDKARRILGSMCLLPSYLQTITLDVMELKGYIKRVNRYTLEIISSKPPLMNNKDYNMAVGIK